MPPQAYSSFIATPDSSKVFIILFLPKAVASIKALYTSSGFVRSVIPNIIPVKSTSTKQERLPFHQSRANNPLSPTFNLLAFSVKY